VTPAQYQPGQILPGTVYRVVRHLATGGMGSVYDVEDTTVEKRYVLKTLHPNLVSREDLALRMRDEAKSLAKLQHPNIVDVVTAGVTSDAQKMPFYVMERLIGQNLRVVLDKTGALHVPHAYRIAIDVADALEHAHENNIVHRDVKPENIFLHRNANGTTTTKLLDFGIVRLLDRKASHTHGKFIGTLRYASPEQITGAKVATATDIYSLGVVLFEMICGRGPFDEAGDAYAVGAAHANVPAPPLSRFVRDVAPDLERLVATALAKNPAERPRDCFAFASELRRILREDEASPRSATAVNLLTSGPPATISAVSSGPTVQGMVPPSVVAPPGATTTEAVPSTVPADGLAPVSPIAPTLAADQPATPKLKAMPSPAPAAGAPANAARAIDRNALTRDSAPVGSPPAFARNDTQMEAESAGAAPAFQATPHPALAGPPSAQPVAFAPAPASQNGTGPISGDATTRPPDRGSFLLVGVAALLAIAMVGGALLAVKKPWQGAPSAAAPAPSPTPSTPSGTASPPVEPSPVTSVFPHPVASPSVSAAVSAAASVPPPKVARPASAPARAPAPPAPAPSAKPRSNTSPVPTAKDVPFDP
jgi:serine/threonine protein kinase